MQLRKLQIKDIPYMQEWMQDEEIMLCFRMNPGAKDEEKIKDFINHSFTETNRHYAIADETDEYQGTISLKNIDYANKNAEYAIVLRRKAMAKGIAKEATRRILEIAFYELKLHKVYLNVLEDNIRAIKFYEKFGFECEGIFKEHLYLRDHYCTLKWYGITKQKFMLTLGG